MVRRLFVVLISICLVVSGLYFYRKYQESYPLAEQVKSIGEISEVRVIAFPQLYSPVAQVGPRDILKDGCIFKSSERERITSLATLTAQIKLRDSVDPHSPEYRNLAIVFRGDSGREMTLFGAAIPAGYSIESTSGSHAYAYGMEQSGNFEKVVYRWIAQLPDVAYPDPSLAASCQYYAKHLRAA